MAKAPVIDFSAYSLERDVPDPEKIHQLIADVHEALTTIGFMYLKNYGVPSSKIKDAFHSFQRFFTLPLSQKLKYLKDDDGYFGYVKMEQETLNPKVPFKDKKETYNFSPCYPDVPFPDEEVPEFQLAMKDLFKSLTPLHNRVLEVIAMGLKLEDHLYFVKNHDLIGTVDNPSVLRAAYYPPLGETESVNEGQLRCGEHSDFGGITLLFQDAQSGLQVKNLNGVWIPVDPIEDTVVVNIGILMQKWTADKLLSTKHRVVLPENPIHRQQARQSIVFFGNPDYNAVISCIDGSNKHDPITCRDFMLSRWSAMFEYDSV